MVSITEVEGILKNYESGNTLGYEEYNMAGYWANRSQLGIPDRSMLRTVTFILAQTVQLDAITGK